MTPEEQEHIKNIVIVATAVGASIGAAVSAAAIIINGWRQRIAETKRHKIDTEHANLRHFRELALEAAVADWKHHVDAAEKWVPDLSRHQDETDRPEVDPFDYFLIKKLKMIQTFGDGTISTSDMPARFEEMRDFHRLFRPKRRTSETVPEK